MRRLVLAAFFVVAGCANSTGVLPVAADSYSITEQYPTVRGGMITAKKQAYSEAADFCEAKGKVVQTIKSEDKQMRGQDTPTFILDFHCVPDASQRVLE